MSENESAPAGAANARTRGLALNEYDRFGELMTSVQRTGDGGRVKPSRKIRGICSVDGCTRPHSAKSYCRTHYERVKALGRTEPVSSAERFWSHVDRSGNCWIWRGAVATNGYGRLSRQSRHLAAHRFAWQIIKGDLPEGMQLDHRCHERLCVNPDHLRLVTGWQNQQNHQGPTVVSSTGVRGVFPAQRKSGGYVIAVTLRGKKYREGPFESLADAESAVIDLRNSLCTHNDMDRVA